MLRSLLCWMSLCLAVLGCEAKTAPRNASKYDIELSDLIAEMETLSPAGVSATLFDIDVELISIRAGHADIEHAILFDESTRVTIGELSEIIVSTMVLRCVEMGKIDLDRPFGAYASPLPISMDSAAGRRLSECSIREILYQGTGIRASYALMSLGYDPERTKGQVICEALQIQRTYAERRGGADTVHVFRGR